MAVETNVAERHSDGQRLAVKRNTLILLVSNFATAAFGLGISILIARGLGAAALGAYSLALAWGLTFAQIADLGMNTLLTRDLARAPEKTAVYLRASLLAKTIIGALFTVALLLGASSLAPTETAARALQLGAGLILLNAWYGSFTAILRAFGRMDVILYLNGGGLALQCALTWALIARGWDVDALVFVAVLMQAAQLSGAVVVYPKIAPRPRVRAKFEPLFVWRLTRAGIPFAVAGILAGVELRANIFLLGAMDSERAVGWYSAASRLVEGVRLAPNAFFGAMLPALAALSDAQGKRLYQRAQWGLLAFGLTAALGFTALASWLVEFLYGAAFAPAAPMLIVLGWGLIPTLGVGIVTLWLYARGQERAVNFFLLGALLLQITFAVLLIPVWSGTGAACAALLSDCALWVGMLAYAARRKESIRDAI